MGLDPEVRNCENYEDNSYENCQREEHRKEMLEKCGCLPFSVITEEDYSAIVDNDFSNITELNMIQENRVYTFHN